MVRIFAIVGVFLAVALLGVLYLISTPSSDDQFASCRSSSIAGGAGSIGGPFELVNGDGVAVTDKDVLTKPTLIYFGYTFCPDACPIDVDRNAVALQTMAEAGLDAQGVFISIDPDRDTPEVVKEYGDLFDHIGLTGSHEQVKAASKAYRTFYRKHDAEEDDEYYLVDHSTQSYFVLPEHGFVEFFKRSDTPEKIAQTAACFIENA